MGAIRRDPDHGNRVSGLFDLRTAEDLYKKLRADHAAVQADPTDAYAAYNFVVTGWHLLEWLIPENVHGWRDKRRALRAARPILDVCRDVSTGTKHFEALPKDDAGVAQPEGGGQIGMSGRSWAEGWAPSAWTADLVIHLEGSAARQYGERIALPAFVDLVMEAWEWILAAP